MIDKFDGKYEWLSNFYCVPIYYDGLKYQNVEAAFQAQKTENPIEKMKFTMLSNPSEAKKLGRSINLRPDWDRIKDGVMYELLKKKFEHPTLQRWLFETGDEELVEGNWWNDTYWGVCKGVGKNKLGKLLMRVRDELNS